MSETNNSSEALNDSLSRIKRIYKLTCSDFAWFYNAKVSDILGIPEIIGDHSIEDIMTSIDEEERNEVLWILNRDSLVPVFNNLNSDWWVTYISDDSILETISLLENDENSPLKSLINLEIDRRVSLWMKKLDSLFETISTTKKSLSVNFYNDFQFIFNEFYDVIDFLNKLLVYYKKIGKSENIWDIEKFVFDKLVEFNQYVKINNAWAKNALFMDVKRHLENSLKEIL